MICLTIFHRVNGHVHLNIRCYFDWQRQSRAKRRAHTPRVHSIPFRTCSSKAQWQRNLNYQHSNALLNETVPMAIDWTQKKKSKYRFSICQWKFSIVGFILYNIFVTPIPFHSLFPLHVHRYSLLSLAFFFLSFSRRLFDYGMEYIYFRTICLLFMICFHSACKYLRMPHTIHAFEHKSLKKRRPSSKYIWRECEKNRSVSKYF